MSDTPATTSPPDEPNAPAPPHDLRTFAIISFLLGVCDGGVPASGEALWAFAGPTPPWLLVGYLLGALRIDVRDNRLTPSRESGDAVGWLRAGELAARACRLQALVPATPTPAGKIQESLSLGAALKVES